MAFGHVVGAAKRRLRDGDSRFHDDATVPMRGCMPSAFSMPPDITELAESNSSHVSDANRKITEIFFEEIAALEDALDEWGGEIPPPDWLCRSDETKRLGRLLNKRAWAFQLWDWYAIPARFVEGSVATVWRPDGALNPPVVRWYNVSDWLAESTVEINRHRRRAWELQRARLRNAWIVAGVSLVVMSWLAFH